MARAAALDGPAGRARLRLRPELRGLAGARSATRTAIREAGGGLKQNLAACREQAAERKSCEREARATYQDDMAFARELRRNPDARPTNIPGGIESSEVTTIRVIPAE